jgi:hypothetical protein
MVQREAAQFSGDVAEGERVAGPYGLREAQAKKTKALIIMLERGVPPNIGLLCMEVLVHIYRSAPAQP